MKRYKCNGGDGCAKSGCEFIAHGQPELKTEKVYMCPFNHWRSCRWKEIKVHSSNAPALGGATATTQRQVVGTVEGKQ